MQREMRDSRRELHVSRTRIEEQRALCDHARTVLSVARRHVRTSGCERSLPLGVAGQERLELLRSGYVGFERRRTRRRAAAARHAREGQREDRAIQRSLRRKRNASARSAAAALAHRALPVRPFAQPAPQPEGRTGSGSRTGCTPDGTGPAGDAAESGGAVARLDTQSDPERHSAGAAQPAACPQMADGIQSVTGFSSTAHGPPNVGLGLANSARRGWSAAPQLVRRTCGSKQSENGRQRFSPVQSASASQVSSTHLPPSTPRKPSAQSLGASGSQRGPAWEVTPTVPGGHWLGGGGTASARADGAQKNSAGRSDPRSAREMAATCFRVAAPGSGRKPLVGHVASSANRNDGTRHTFRRGSPFLHWILRAVS